MGRNEKEDRKSTILILSIIVIIVITIILSYFLYNNFNNYYKLYTKNKELNTKINELSKEFNSNTEKNRELVSEKESLSNIEENISDLKNDLFSLAGNLEKKIIDGNSPSKIAYITFDDGPYYSTLEVLDILDKYKIKATFFTIGLDKDDCYDNKGTSCAETYKLEVDKGHTIANHTYSHSIFRGLYSSPDYFINDVKKQEKLIEERTGYKTNIIRFPGGSGTSKAKLGISGTDTILSSLREMGYGWVDWTANDGDGGYVPNTTVAWNNFVKTINEDIEVVLFHDYSRETISILPKAIEYLEENNYIILPMFYDSIKVNK